ncbi:sulfatase modifying factor 1 [Schizosaccharomyces cryophilus OY26]|uniref:Sulfatase modifying factor 1 n=1 Tax=Schizosaccharomyces cryophilus (strain OY26 / ATCC MYA-4695 / CBS 11777 / NBRC 106824 / NRRL Y48691) TaxID=653667 RepID=S9W4Z3_SCHCR|nr:sulfatase modifying factor 1 [Schizosaccharomyces cryophilus OY26]EPY53599.1 sulfatase modifying factor 1 [Schizosaccharomyces cryophilus OY26]
MSSNITKIGSLEVLFSPEIIQQCLQVCQLPTSLLYDEKGLQLFDQITGTKEYYLFNCELAILQRDSDAIAQQLLSPDLPNTVVELGCGAMHKTKHLLDAFERSGRDVNFYALDLNEDELRKGLSQLEQHASYKHVKVAGICGCFDMFLQNIEKFRGSVNGQISILYLGSSIGNFNRNSATEFLKSFSDRLAIGDKFLLSFDHRNSAELVQRAYDDSAHITETFEKNILTSANRVFGEELFNENDWDYVSKYDEDLGVHRAYLRAKKDTAIAKGPMVFNFKAGHHLLCEESWKSNDDECREIIRNSNFEVDTVYTNAIPSYSIYVGSKSFPKLPQLPKEAPISLREWSGIRDIWIFITNKLLNDSNIFKVWIPLRHPFVFYMGHIPVFNDIYLSRIFENPVTASKRQYWDWFQRGIDPDVENPENCHWHSQIPTNWPSPNELRSYEIASWQNHILKLYDGSHTLSPFQKRIVWLCYEHVAMHIETTLYIYVQSFQDPKQNNFICGLPPCKIPKLKKDPSWIKYYNGQVLLGLPVRNDRYSNSNPEEPDEQKFFGWDNEKPSRTNHVPSFQIANRPISNGEYLNFVNNKPEGDRRYPKLWKLIDGKLYLKTMYGLLPLDNYLSWPVMASFDELNAYAAFKGCRLPTEEELNYYYDQVLHRKSEAYVSTEGMATGFQQLHPAKLKDDETPQIFTGAWEWTSTVLEKHEGFEPEALYPDYTKDFFDGKHNVVLGGSFATVPRIANRRSFRNFYQRQYEYAWITARLAKGI